MTRPSLSVQFEIQQQRPFKTKAQEAVVALFRTRELLARHLIHVIEQHDITFAQYNVLRILRGAGEPLPTMDIAERMIEQTPGVTRMLDRMERKRLVHRERHDEDRRQVLCSITQKGLDLVNALDEPMNNADEECFAALSPAELDQFIGLLDTIRASLRQ